MIWLLIILAGLLWLWLVVDTIRKYIRAGRERREHRRHGGTAPRK